MYIFKRVYYYQHFSITHEFCVHKNFNSGSFKSRMVISELRIS